LRKKSPPKVEIVGSENLQSSIPKRKPPKSLRQKPQRFESHTVLPQSSSLAKDSISSKRDEIREKLNQLLQEKATLKSRREESVEKLQLLKQV
jgi:hypothetical protein